MSHYRRYLNYAKGANDGKAIPVPAWTGPEGSKSLRLPDFKIVGPRSW